MGFGELMTAACAAGRGAEAGARSDSHSLLPSHQWQPTLAGVPSFMPYLTAEQMELQRLWQQLWALQQSHSHNLMVIADKSAKIKSLKASAKRAPVPPTVPPQLWHRAMREAPKCPGSLRWVLREGSISGFIHDERLGAAAFDRRYPVARRGMRVWQARDGTDGSEPEHRRNGKLTREHEVLGQWYAQFEDEPTEEAISCGKNDVYDAHPLPPGKTGELILQMTDLGYDLLSCRDAFTGEMVKDPNTNDVKTIEVTAETIVSEVRATLEACADCRAGLRLLTPLQKVLEPSEDLRTVDEVLLLPPNPEDLDETGQILEFYSLAPDGSREMYWHS